MHSSCRTLVPCGIGRKRLICGQGAGGTKIRVGSAKFSKSGANCASCHDNSGPFHWLSGKDFRSTSSIAPFNPFSRLVAKQTWDGTTFDCSTGLCLFWIASVELPFDAGLTVPSGWPSRAPRTRGGGGVKSGVTPALIGSSGWVFLSLLQTWHQWR